MIDALLILFGLVIVALALVIVALVNKQKAPPPNALSGEPTVELATAPAAAAPIIVQRPIDQNVVDFKVGEAEREAMANVEARATNALLTALERLNVPIAENATVAYVAVASEDLKGRVVGRDGKNMRAFESACGVDLLIDERPGEIGISTFDPKRRAVAVATLTSLLQEGRIQPARIEAIAERETSAVESNLAQWGAEAAKSAGVGALPKDVIKALGELKFATSYGQNVLAHSVECAQIAAFLAAELKLDAALAARAALLHDIGKRLGPEFGAAHALAGAQFLKRFGESEAVCNAVGAHHHDIPPTSPEARLVIVADAISASRPAARSEALETFLKRQRDLEALLLERDEIQEAVVLRNGREVRAIVKPNLIDDSGVDRLAHELAIAITASGLSEGPTQVLVIREYRATAESEPRSKSGNRVSSTE